MGLDMTYIAGEATLSYRLSASDAELINYLKEHGFPEEIEKIFGISEFGEKTGIETAVLRDALDRFLSSIRTKRNCLPYAYVLREEIPRGSGLYSTGGGVISGFKIKGVLHSIEGGLNKCVLTTMKRNESGKWHGCAPKDVRDRRIIKVDGDNLGSDIEIKKRRKPRGLINNLERLLSFLSETNQTRIQKILA